MKSGRWLTGTAMPPAWHKSVTAETWRRGFLHLRTPAGEFVPIAVDQQVGFRLSLPVMLQVGLLLREHEVVEDDGTPNAERERLAVEELLLVGRQEVRTERVPGNMRSEKA
ncbi:MAG: hypothetical protein GXX83_11035 [Gaiellales bacterium]|nr:hypothetical protein [Gaiellales bacterium]